MIDVKDKIAKLLALANSPNEYEARDALLKARALMAKYKLRTEEVKQEEDCKVIKETIGVECTKMTNTWTVQLAAIIAEHYCCKVFHQRFPHAKKVEIGIVGLADDFDICKKIIYYARDCILSKCKELAKENAGIATRTEIRELCNAYGWGFCEGLLEMFHKQDHEHQGWGLVLKTPQAVLNLIAQYGKPGVYTNGKTGGWLNRYADKGYEDGEQFNPSIRLQQPNKDPISATEETK